MENSSSSSSRAARRARLYARLRAPTVSANPPPFSRKKMLQPAPSPPRLKRCSTMPSLRSSSRFPFSSLTPVREEREGEEEEETDDDDERSFKCVVPPSSPASVAPSSPSSSSSSPLPLLRLPPSPFSSSSLTYVLNPEEGSAAQQKTGWVHLAPPGTVFDLRCPVCLRVGVRFADPYQVVYCMHCPSTPRGTLARQTTV